MRGEVTPDKSGLWKRRIGVGSNRSQKLSAEVPARGLTGLALVPLGFELRGIRRPIAQREIISRQPSATGVPACQCSRGH